MYKKIMVVSVALSIFPILASGMPICGQDLCESKTSPIDCRNVVCGDSNITGTCDWKIVTHHCTYNGSDVAGAATQNNTGAQQGDAPQ